MNAVEVWRSEWNALPADIRQKWLNRMVLYGCSDEVEECFREAAARALEELVRETVSEDSNG